MEFFTLSIESPIGFLILESNYSHLCAIRFSENQISDSEIKPAILSKTEKQLNEYFEGKRFDFDLEMEPKGTVFQKMVWDLLRHIPFGQTTTYLEIAKKLGSPTYTRAVGLANGKNPIPIIIPCHRVIGSNGKLIGYAGGIKRKKQLLLHELSYNKKGKLF
jgi:methylated-DNA-[protein]-cysteine S-methyltransferase